MAATVTAAIAEQTMVREIKRFSGSHAAEGPIR